MQSGYKHVLWIHAQSRHSAHHLPVFACQRCYPVNEYLLVVGSCALAFLSPGFLIYKISLYLLQSCCKDQNDNPLKVLDKVLAHPK